MGDGRMGDGKTVMETTLADLVRQAAHDARDRAAAFSGGAGRDDLPWAVTRAFDAWVRGHVERDPRIEDERDRVLIAAVNLAEARPQRSAEDDSADEDAPDDVRAFLRALIEAIDGLEWVTLSQGIVNRRAAAARLGVAGRRVVPLQ